MTDRLTPLRRSVRVFASTLDEETFDKVLLHRFTVTCTRGELEALVRGVGLRELIIEYESADMTEAARESLRWAQQERDTEVKRLLVSARAVLREKTPTRGEA
jgi:hypothetical protein